METSWIDYTRVLLTALVITTTYGYEHAENKYRPEAKPYDRDQCQCLCMTGPDCQQSQPILYFDISLETSFQDVSNDMPQCRICQQLRKQIKDNDMVYLRYCRTMFDKTWPRDLGYGQSANNYSVANYNPRFSRRYQRIDVTDGDLSYNATTYPHVIGCECHVFVYEIIDVDPADETERFQIERYTGRLSVKKIDPPFELFKVTVAVRNTNTGAVDETKLTVVNQIEGGPNQFYPLQQDGFREEDSPKMAHHIEKRSVIHATDVNFTLTKLTTPDPSGTIQVGSRVRFEVAIVFPAQNMDMLVEIFAPDNETTVMILCDVVVTSTGSNLNPSLPGTVVFDSRDGIATKPDRAIIDFGEVTNSEADIVDIEKSTIRIEYEAVMVVNAATVNGATYWISFGAEFNNENEIYVAQSSETANTTSLDVSDSVTFTVHGPTNLAIGSASLVTLDMYVPYTSHDYILRAFTPIDTVGVMSICYAQFDSYAANFQCGNDPSLITSGLDPDPLGVGNYQGTITLGHLVNKGSRDAVPNVNDNKITAKFVVKVYDDTSLINSILQMGLAFEKDTSELWVGNLNITADAAATSGFSIPALVGNSTSLTNWEATIGEPFWVRFQIQIPPPSVAGVATEYVMEMLAPFDGGASVFQVCKLKLLSVGADMPCVHMDDLEAEYSTRETGGQFADKAVLDLGFITNMELNNGAGDDIIEVETVMTPLTSHPGATPGSTHTAVFGITAGGSYVSIMSMDVTLTGTSTLTAVTNTTAPSFTFSYWDTVGDVPVKGTTKVDIDMTTIHNTLYPELDLELLMPSDATNTYFHICKARVETVGDNIPCLNSQWSNERVQKYSQFNDDMIDRATLDLGPLCNYQFVNDVTQDVSRLTFYLKVLDVPAITHNSQHWLSAGILYDTDKLWVGQLSLNAQRGNTYTPTTAIHSALQRNDTMDPLPIGYYAKFSLLLKIPNGDVYDLKVEALSSAEGFDICSVRVIAAGDNLPCMTDDVTLKTKTEWPNGGASSMTADFGVTTNFGSLNLISNGVYDANTAIVEIMGYANPAVATAGSYDLTVNTYLDTAMTNGNKVTHSITGITTTTSVASIDTNVATNVSIGLSVGEIAGGDTVAEIAPGEVKGVTMTAIIPEDTIYNLEFVFIIPNAFIGKLEIGDAAITSVGKNLPCVDPLTAAVLTSQSGIYKDTATFSMNYVCNSAMAPGDVQANTIVFVAYVRALPNGLATLGETLTVTGSVDVFGSTLTVESQDFTVTDPALHPGYVKSIAGVSNLTLIAIDGGSPISMTIGQTETLGINITIPQYSSSKLLFDIELPHDGSSACITVASIKVIGSTGRNVFVDPEGNSKGVIYTPTYNDTVGTGQTNYAFLDLGIVTSTGLSQTLNTFMAGDDDVRLEVTIQMADCSLSVHGHSFVLSIGNQAANYVFIYNIDVTVSRDGLEKPDILMSVGFAPESTSTVVVLEGSVYHSNTSTAEGKNTTASVGLPMYLHHPGTIVTTSTRAYTVATDVPYLLEITFDNLYFSDVFNYKVTLSIDSSFELPPGFSAVNSRFQYWTETEYVIRSNSYDLEDWFPFYPNGYDVTFYDVEAGTGSACNNPLGMTSLAIQDCQITGTKGKVASAGPKYGRKGGSNVWEPIVRDNGFAQNRYFEVYFGSKVKVTEIEVEQTSGNPHYATEFDVEYSLDGYSWFGKESVSIGSLPGSLETILLGSKTETRYLRLIVTNDTSLSTKSQLGIKFEFNGCVVLNDVTPAQACTNAAATTTAMPADFYARSFVADTNSKVYQCDRVTDSVEYLGHCITSADSGATWQELDRSLASMIGYESSQHRVYGYGQDMEAILMSTDSGAIWEAVSVDELNNDKLLTTWTNAIDVSEDASADIDRSTPHFSYTVGSWGATYDGMYYNNGIKSKWTN